LRDVVNSEIDCQEGVPAEGNEIKTVGSEFCTACIKYSILTACTSLLGKSKEESRFGEVLNFKTRFFEIISKFLN